MGPSNPLMIALIEYSLQLQDTVRADGEGLFASNGRLRARLLGQRKLVMLDPRSAAN